MKSQIIGLVFLIGCSRAVKTEANSEGKVFQIPEIQYLHESRAPLSQDMREKNYEERWDAHNKLETNKYYAFIRTAYKIRNLSMTIRIKESLNYFKEGRQKKFYFENGFIDRIVNTEPFNVPDQGSYEGDYGIRSDFKKGKLDTVGCYFQQDPCDQTIHFNRQGEVIKVTREKTQCKKGCGHLVPYRIPGTYFIADNKVRVRKEPSTKGEILTELNKDNPIEVIEDAEIYEEVFPHYGTWGKVKLDDGREGYVYGAFLRAPGEPDVVAIREKAEEWKKKNGWKGK